VMEVEATSLHMPDGRPVGAMNMSTISTGEIAGDRQVQSLVRQLGQWVEQARDYGGTPRPGMFARSFYQVPDNPYDQMRVARGAVIDDDIIGGLADATEAIAFDGGLKWESANADDADVFNQLSADINLDAKIREMWRETFTVDSFVCAKLWDTASYTLRGTTENGNKKKKTYKVYAPTRLVMLKPENTVPIGWGPLREDRLAWQATTSEIGKAQDAFIGDQDTIDPLMAAFFTSRYIPGPDEAAELTQWGVNIERLLAINPDWVFRHTSTRPDWAKFPDIRLRAVFSLLDLKRQLIASDRATLIGAANYILLIRKGSKEQPATQDEVTNLKANYNFLAKLPVIISDHRLEIDVIAPKLDFVLKKEAYEALDNRILTRVLATFVTTGTRGAGPNASDTFSDVLSSVIQNKRHMIKRTLEREFAKAIIDHPKNDGVFSSKPSLVFTPRTVALGTNQAMLSALLALRTQREISRDTILEYLGLDEATEAQRLEIEELLYDDIFKTQIPFAAPGAGGAPNAPASNDPTAPKAAPAQQKTQNGTPKQTTPNGTPESPSSAGRRGGGRPRGGGTSTQSPASQTAPRTANGNKSTRTAASEEPTDD
jgi:hypothetical protein